MYIVFDIDEVLNNLLITTFRLAGIDERKVKMIRKYNIRKSNILTVEEADRISELWKYGSTYEACAPAYGIGRISRIANTEGVNVINHSLCENIDAARSKINWVSRHMDTTNIKFIMEIKKKTPIIDADVVVEDNLEYLMNYRKGVKLLIDKTYNKDEEYGIKTSDYGILRMNTTYDAIRYIEELIGVGEYR